MSLEEVSAEVATSYLSAMEFLVQTVQALSLCSDLPSIQAIVRNAARELTGADGASFVLLDGDNCFYADEDAIEPLWKGLRFPTGTCVSGWVMRHRQPAVIADIYGDPRVPVAAYRPTFVKSMAVVPIRTLDPIGAIGAYWAHHHVPTQQEVNLLQALADSTAVAMESVRVRFELEDHVRRRTRELEAANEEIRRLSLVDELTGLHNRRGFFLLAEHERKALARLGSGAFILYIDADGLKTVNDRDGHGAGDQLLRTLAQILEMTFRNADIIARLGGDEFCVFGRHDIDSLNHAKQRFDCSVAEFNRVAGSDRLLASSGVYTFLAADVSLESAVARADEAMYIEKRARHAALLHVVEPVAATRRA